MQHIYYSVPKRSALSTDKDVTFTQPVEPTCPCRVRLKDRAVGGSFRWDVTHGVPGVIPSPF